ncbi:MAG: deoxyribose-phosphate aldolase [Candidatus Margulisiibacteriota bacterium]
MKIKIDKPSDLIPYIEHTNLKPEATPNDIIKLCEEAKEYGFFGVCVNPRYIELAKKELKDSKCKVVAVIGFPLGANLSESKADEAKRVIGLGADEVDMVIAIGAIKAGDKDYVLKDINGVIEAAGEIPVKVIIETALLNDDEKKLACELSKQAGAAFVKTSTGFSTAGAKEEDIRLMRSVVGDKLGVKAAGGIRDYETAKRMIEAGANRLGCSASVEIVAEKGKG